MSAHTYLVTRPVVRDDRSDAAVAHCRLHLFNTGVGRYALGVGHLVGCHVGSERRAATRKLPVDERQGVHVSFLERVEDCRVDRIVENLQASSLQTYSCHPQHLTRKRGDVVTHLWRHVADSSDAVGILADVHRVGLGVVFDGQTEVGDAALTVVLHQNVLRLEVAMRNFRFGSLPCNNSTKARQTS